MVNYKGLYTATYSAKVRQSTVQDIVTATQTTVNWNTEVWDTHDLHDNSTNNQRLTAPHPGKYMVTGSIEWENNSNGNRYLYLLLNGTIKTQLARAANGKSTININELYELIKGDYLHIDVYQDSGSNKHIRAPSRFSMINIRGQN